MIRRHAQQRLSKAATRWEKDAPTKTKMIIYFIIKRLKHRIRRAYSPLVPCTKTKRPDFEIRPFPSQRLRLRTTVLNYLDSNQERQNQNLLCYHYTIVQSDARKQVQRYGKESIFQKKSSANGRGSKKNSTERGKFGSKSPDTLTTAQGLRRFDSIDKIDNSMQ